MSMQAPAGQSMATKNRHFPRDIAIVSTTEKTKETRHDLHTAQLVKARHPAKYTRSGLQGRQRTVADLGGTCLRRFVGNAKTPHKPSPRDLGSQKYTSTTPNVAFRSRIIHGKRVRMCSIRSSCLAQLVEALIERQGNGGRKKR